MHNPTYWKSYTKSNNQSCLLSLAAAVVPSFGKAHKLRTVHFRSVWHAHQFSGTTDSAIWAPNRTISCEDSRTYISRNFVLVPERNTVTAFQTHKHIVKKTQTESDIT